jgi:hypothetical protein
VASLRDVRVAGGAGAADPVTGFNSGIDVIQSKTSAVAGGGTGPAALVAGATAASGSDTLITFVDGSTMRVVGVAPAAIKFTQ